ncbi:MAG: S8 family serine peptidase [Calditrichaeota bacterium]|nr:S8 family serine peptidase [Calditrichota bacterium]
MKAILQVTLGILFGVLTALATPPDTPSKFSPAIQKIVQAEDPHTPLKVWIFLTDKGPNVHQRLEALQQRLSPRARLRRLRVRQAQQLVDIHDLPVYRPYIQQIRDLVEKIRHTSRWLNAVSAEIQIQQLEALAQLPFVIKIDVIRSFRAPQPEIRPISLPLRKTTVAVDTALDYGPSWIQNHLIQVPAVHQLGYNGEGIIIAMLDAGFDNLEHESFQHLNILDTWDFVNNDADVTTEKGQMGSGVHGTLTLSAVGGFAPGRLIGPAYGATFLLAKTENTDYERHIEEDNWVAGAEWADSLGADIISSSLGYRDGFTHGEADYTWEDMDGNTTIVTRGADIAASRGILVVNSAGNEGYASVNTLVAPADGDSVMAVGAVDSNGIRVKFSSVGPTADGRIKPDIMAMGASVLSASPYDPTQYVRVSGTSLSCPLAAGSAALVLQVNPRLSNMQVLQALKRTASQADAPDNLMGWGILNAYEAAFYYTPRVRHTPLPDTLLLQPEYEIQATITSRFPLKMDSVAVYYRFQSGNWQRLTMKRVQDSLFIARIPGPGDSGKIEYYIVAPADSGTAYLPSFAPQQTFQFYVHNINLTPPPSIPGTFELYPPYPNPFNAMTRIPFYLTDNGRIELSIYNNLGHRVAILKEGYEEKGLHVSRWNAQEFPSGVYFIQLKAFGKKKVRKVVLNK